VTVFAYQAADGTLKELHTVSTRPADYHGNNSTAEIQKDRAGKFVLNRGHDRIPVFAIDPAQGTLTLIEQVKTQGKTPSNFSLDPTAAYLFAANENSVSIILFHVNAATGRLRPAG
jgi:6-phosphogluconolactonase